MNIYALHCSYSYIVVILTFVFVFQPIAHNYQMYFKHLPSPYRGDEND